MSDESQRNSVVNVAADINVHHAQLGDIRQYTPEKLSHLQRGGIRDGAGRTEAQTQQMLDKIPAADRSGVDAQSAAEKVKDYLSDKDASHIKPHSKGGSGHPDNIKWESSGANRARGDNDMTWQEQIRLDAGVQIDNFAGALNAGLKAVPRGAVVGALTTLPFSALRNALRVVRGEMSAEDAAKATIAETATGAGVGAVASFTVKAVATAFTPVGAALAAISPALLVVGGAGMIHEFFNILETHKQQTQKYYEQLTQQELDHLQKIEDELIYEHAKNMEFLDREHAKNLEFLDKARAINDKISTRPVESGIEGALKRYLESAAIAKSLGAEIVVNNLLSESQNILPGPN